MLSKFASHLIPFSPPRSYLYLYVFYLFAFHISFEIKWEKYLCWFDFFTIVFLSFFFFYLHHHHTIHHTPIDNHQHHLLNHEKNEKKYEKSCNDKIRMRNIESESKHVFHRHNPTDWCHASESSKRYDSKSYATHSLSVSK